MEHFDEQTNPFAAPQSAAVGPVTDSAMGDAQQIPRVVLTLLLSTRPWIVLFSVLCVLIVVGLVVATFATLMSGEHAGPAEIAGTLGSNLVAAAIYVVAAFWLVAYARRISDYAAAQNSQTLAKALEAQKSLWKLFGVTLLVYLGLSVGFVIVAMFFGVWMAMS